MLRLLSSSYRRNLLFYVATLMLQHYICTTSNDLLPGLLDKGSTGRVPRHFTPTPDFAMSAPTWTLDLYHSEISFKVKHLMIATVTGKFEKYDISLESSAEDFSDAKVKFSIDASSINTGIEARDNHLRSDDFFGAEQYPSIRFESSSMKKVSEDRYVLSGDLSIRDVTKTVDFDVELGGSMVDPYGNHKVGFEVSAKLLRKEFKLMWDALTESGGVVVSDEVRLSANIQFQKSAA